MFSEGRQSAPRLSGPDSSGTNSCSWNIVRWTVSQPFSEKESDPDADEASLARAVPLWTTGGGGALLMRQRGRQRRDREQHLIPINRPHSADFSWSVSAGAAEWKGRTQWGSVWVRVMTWRASPEWPELTKEHRMDALCHLEDLKITSLIKNVVWTGDWLEL